MVSTKSKRKPSLTIPKIWGRSGKKKSESVSGGDTDIQDAAQECTPDSTSTSVNESDDKSRTDGENLGSQPKDVEETTDNDQKPSSSSDSSNDDRAESLEKEETPVPQSTDDSKKETEPEHHHSGAPSTNQTRSGVLYLTPPSPVVPHPYARPMPFPYVPQQPPPPRNQPPTLLSSLLSAFLPRPQNMPPPPYGPSMPPSSPFPPGGNSAIVSLVLRLVLISMGTLILDFLGLGSHSDAFLPTPAQHYTFERVNDRYRRDRSALRQALESPPPGVTKRRWKRVFGRRKKEAASTLVLAEEFDGNNTQSIETPILSGGALYNRTVIIVDMKPDSRVGNGIAEQLRDTVTFLIEQHRDHVDKRNHDARNAVTSKLLSSKLLPPHFLSTRSSNNHRTHNGIRSALGTEVEVVLFLDSPGGTVHDYGLASSHLSRLRNEPYITLSVCVDRVAASGGYMMACQATPGHLFAAPFAMVGSIGVLMETVNVNEVLKRYGVKPLVIKAGKNKAPLKTLGEVTPEELKMAQDDADVIHEAFQQWVVQSRPNVVVSKDWIEKVCTGAVFLGQEARELGLVDRVLTSDEYVAERIAAGDRVLRLIPYKGPQFGLKISPLDLLLGMDAAEGRAKMREKIQGLGRSVFRSVAPLFRAGAAVSILNHLASLQSQRPDYRWSA
eukprot:CAMPEP_0172535564 /NCGR_PEP_ID=MMETSP1067-20121228/7514_1 /TAXON_ID=265564 ORGANISM="Thalassiosira punctigera, Strain Tpunct2005C2" /NCGR_SAMPLE_ID=MMETSP1067 /ASSEMBLY_ACC=CAM_ASM_000444 /LENGTH=667 /DNA_ID=CAMNT_0013320501 /DNA_START=244 /DNA_END=2247 /DNA_ORIENTATION=+